MHLAIFVFVSGYFYKFSSHDKPIKYFKKKFLYLIIPFYMYNFAYAIVVKNLKYLGFGMGLDISFDSIMIEPIINGHQFIYNMGGWFIIPLFIVQIFNCFLLKFVCVVKRSFKKLNHIDLFIFFLYICLGIMGNSLAIIGFNKGWYLVASRTLYFLPFYGFGICYRNTLEKYINLIPSICIFFAIIIIKLIIVYNVGRMPIYTPSWCNDFVDGPILPILVGYLGIIFWVRVVDILSSVFKNSKIVKSIANNTFTIMMNQFLGFMIVKSIFYTMSKMFNIFLDFDVYRYKNDIWYYYLPHNQNYFLIIYVVVGIAFSLIIQNVINIIKKESKYIIWKNYIIDIKLF